MQREMLRTLFRFVVVGGSAFLVRAGIYALLSRFLWPLGSRIIENVLAIVCATVFSYLCNFVWTFQHQSPAPGSFFRFIGVSLLGLSIDSLLFYALHVRFGIYDGFIVVFNSAAIAFLTFLLHRRFTFHADPWRKIEKSTHL